MPLGFGFRIRGFRRRRGLFTRTDVVMPVHRVQGIKLGTGFVRYRFGWHGLSFVSLAQDMGASSHAVAPFAKLDEIAPIVRAAGFDLPGQDADWRRASERYMFDSAVLIAGFFIVLAVIAGIVADCAAGMDGGCGGGAAGAANQGRTIVTMPPMARLAAAGGVADAADQGRTAVTIPPMACLAAARRAAGVANQWWNQCDDIPRGVSGCCWGCRRCCRARGEPL